MSRATLGSWIPRGRTLHLIDVENLAGGSDATHSEVAQAAREYVEAAVVQANDLLTVGVGQSMALNAAAAFDSARIVVGRGLDGAEHSLMSSHPPKDIAQRFERVVIGSGDHIFTGFADTCVRLDVETWVVARVEALSRMLASHAHHVACLPSIRGQRAA